MAIQQTLGLHEIVVSLDDMDDFDTLYAANTDYINEHYGSKERALKHCCDGGLKIGGGAMPVYRIHFAD